LWATPPFAALMPGMVIPMLARTHARKVHVGSGCSKERSAINVAMAGDRPRTEAGTHTDNLPANGTNSLFGSLNAEANDARRPVLRIGPTGFGVLALTSIFPFSAFRRRPLDRPVHAHPGLAKRGIIRCRQLAAPLALVTSKVMTPRTLFHLLPALLVVATWVSELHANDIQVSNPTLTATNTVNGTTQVQFDIIWENSWRTGIAPNNWDAAWVFVKYRDANTGEWNHAQLGSDAQHSAPAGSTIATGLLTPGTDHDAATNWGVGAFIHRSANGSGIFTATGVQLRWNYGQNGITYEDIAEVKVFAVEMVWVPEGSFSVGDGTTTAVQGHFRNGSTNTPLLISSEAALTLGGTANGNLANNDASGMSQADDFNNTTTQTLPAAYPKGFAGFYVMKYSITQQQYVDFLNCLSRTQQNTRTGTGLAAGVASVTNRYVMSNASTLQRRNGIRCNGTIDANAPITFYCDLNGNGTGGEEADGQWIACNYPSWADLAAYLDWNGLRPMSELEYEKACRGPVTPVAGEFAWGSTSITGAANITNGGAINESSNTAEANAVFGGNLLGSMRVGVFATGATTRAQSGASYYGAMELSGNLYERAATVGNATGRLFAGTLGDGALDAMGNANAATWPGTDATGAGFRGGSGSVAERFLRVSDRQGAATTLGGRVQAYGGRGVRLFP